MAATRAPADAGEELYLSVANLLHRLAWRAARRYGLDHEETLSVAHLGYARAVRSYDPDRGAKFSTWVHWVAGNALKSEGRRLARQRLRPVAGDWCPAGEHRHTERAVQPPPRSSLARLAGRLGPDATAALELALERPERTAPRRRSAMVEALAELGWCGGRILASFAEVRAALTE